MKSTRLPSGPGEIPSAPLQAEGGHASLCPPSVLAPTTDLRAVIKGVLHDHLGVAERVLAETVFPDSAGVKAAKGLVG
jgi:uncharacterized protein (DUF1501 family)